jgi:hypothetical protein
MLIFTPKARQVFGDAVSRYGSDADRAVWQEWAATHRAVRNGPEDDWHDDSGPMPHRLRAALLTALERMKDDLRQQTNGEGLSEDELADLGNDLSYVLFLMKAVRNPPASVT